MGRPVGVCSEGSKITALKFAMVSPINTLASCRTSNIQAAQSACGEKSHVCSEEYANQVKVILFNCRFPGWHTCSRLLRLPCPRDGEDRRGDGSPNPDQQ